MRGLEIAHISYRNVNRLQKKVRGGDCIIFRDICGNVNTGFQMIISEFNKHKMLLLMGDLITEKYQLG